MSFEDYHFTTDINIRGTDYQFIFFDRKDSENWNEDYVELVKTSPKLRKLNKNLLWFLQ